MREEYEPQGKIGALLIVISTLAFIDLRGSGVIDWSWWIAFVPSAPLLIVGLVVIFIKYRGAK